MVVSTKTYVLKFMSRVSICMVNYLMVRLDMRWHQAKKKKANKKRKNWKLSKKDYNIKSESMWTPRTPCDEVHIHTNNSFPLFKVDFYCLFSSFFGKLIDLSPMMDFSFFILMFDILQHETRMLDDRSCESTLLTFAISFMLIILFSHSMWYRYVPSFCFFLCFYSFEHM